jgi:prepilin-type processing-associated H-X9-DG protein
VTEQAKPGVGTWDRKTLLVAVAAIVVLALIAFAAMQMAAVQRRKTGWELWQDCGSNLKKVAFALQVYADDHGDTFPPHVAWTGRLQPYVDSQERFRCPAAPEQDVGYAYAEYLAGKTEAAVPCPEETFTFWDAREGSSTPAFRHGSSTNVAYVDGHVAPRTGDEVFWHCTQLFERELESADTRSR